MRSFVLLPLAAVLVFAATDPAEARGGGGARKMFGSTGSKDKASSQSSADKGSTPGSADKTSSRSSARTDAAGNREYRPQPSWGLQLSYRGRDYRSQPAYSSASYYPYPTKASLPTAATAKPVSVGTVPAAAPVDYKQEEARKAQARTETKYRDPGAVELCSGAGYVFDSLNGCQPKGAQIASRR